MDITGPFTPSSKRNTSVLMVTDQFSKWAEAYALKDITAKTVANVFCREWVCRFGCPLSVHTDQGTNFCSEMFQETMKLLGIEKTRTTAYHPQGNGQAERMMSTLGSIVKGLQEHGDDWDDRLPFAMMAYRSSVHATTEETPHKVVTGRQMVLPIDVITDVNSAYDPMPVCEYCSKSGGKDEKFI